MDLLLKSGCPLEAKNDSGKTALFTAAEFSPTVKPIQLLLDAGAQADVSDEHGNHILENARAPQVKRLLSRTIGKPIPRRAPDPWDALETIPLDASQWRAAKKRIGVVFDSLAKSGLVVL
jgi:bifunctional non-homologous end joining protein LigD